MQTVKNPRLLFVLVTLLTGLLVLFAFLSFNHSLQQRMQQEITQRLQEVVEPNILSFHLQMEEQIKKVNTFAEFLGNNWELDRDVKRSLLQSAAKNNDLLRCALAFPDGSFITHDGKDDGNVSKDAFFVANMQGEFYITDPRPAVVDPTSRVILFAAPVLDDNKQVVGSVIYSYLCDNLDKIFNLKALNGEMNLVIIKGSGELLVSSGEHVDAGQNLLEQLLSSCTHKEHPATECMELVGDHGSLLITLDGGSSIYLRYDKLDYKDWYMVATCPEQAAGAGIAFAAQSQWGLSVVLVVLLVLYMGVLLTLGMLQHKLLDIETGALTLYAFKRQAKRIFRARESENYVVIKLDIKDFKLINRIYSFDTGDKVVKSMAQALQIVLCDRQTAVARMGVDVFVLLLPFESEAALLDKRQAFIKQFQLLMEHGFSTKVVFPTGQYVLKPEDFPKPDMNEILEKVNFAHRAAKQKSDVIIDYEEDIEQTALFEKTIEDRMDGAIAAGEFALYLQPKVCLKNERLCGAEALVRWKVGERYFMYPTDFVPVFEKNGFIVQLDKHMFDSAAAYIRQCLDRGQEPIPISVNFSRHHLNNSNFVSELCVIADRYNVPHRYLEIELTESAFLGHIDSMVALIDELHSCGFLISMDDFGSGYSCFAQLKDLAVDVIKIDKGFFTESIDEQRAEIVLGGIFHIAQQLGIITVAEGIEQQAQVEMLRAMGCDIVQGYYYARPMPADEIDAAAFVGRAD